MIRYFSLACCLFLFSVSAYGDIHVFGNSHANVFTGFPKTHVHHLGPITMHRVGRDVTQLIDIKDYNIDPDDTIVMVFGEIDTRCHVKAIAQRHSKSIEWVLKDLGTRYFKAISEIFPTTPPNQIIIYGILPATNRYRSPQKRKHFKNIPKTVTPGFHFIGTLEERISYNLRLNEILKELCARYGLHFFDILPLCEDENHQLRADCSDGGLHIGTHYFPVIQKAFQKFLTDCKLGGFTSVLF